MFKPMQEHDDFDFRLRVNNLQERKYCHVHCCSYCSKNCANLDCQVCTNDRSWGANPWKDPLWSNGVTFRVYCRLYFLVSSMKKKNYKLSCTFPRRQRTLAQEILLFIRYIWKKTRPIGKRPIAWTFFWRKRLTPKKVSNFVSFLHFIWTLWSENGANQASLPVFCNVHEVRRLLSEVFLLLASHFFQSYTWRRAFFSNFFWLIIQYNRYSPWKWFKIRCMHEKRHSFSEELIFLYLRWEMDFQNQKIKFLLKAAENYWLVVDW